MKWKGLFSDSPFFRQIGLYKRRKKCYTDKKMGE